MDLIVSSFDKNFMVPVEGALVYSHDSALVHEVSTFYPGRGSISGVLDVFITLLSLGKEGWKRVWQERLALFHSLKEQVESLGNELGLSLLPSSKNDISLALSLSPPSSSSSSSESKEGNENNDDNKDIDFTRIGSQLFLKQGMLFFCTFFLKHLSTSLSFFLVTGSRVVHPQQAHKTIGTFTFIGWGSHHTPPSSPLPSSSEETVTIFSKPYLSCAAGMGVQQEDIEVFIKKARKVLKKAL